MMVKLPLRHLPTAWAPERAERARMRALGLLLICIATLTPSLGLADVCPGQEVTTTPAAPPSQRSYDLYRKQLNSVANADVDLILLGDSLAEGWDSSFLPPIKVVNLGVGGDKTQNVLWRLNSTEWQKMRPGTVFTMLGTNNLGSQPCAIIAGLSKVVERATSIWPMAQVVFLDITPRGKDFLEYNDPRVEINAAMGKIAGIKTLNVDEEITCGWKKESDGACANYLLDNLHFSSTGYSIIRNRLTPIGKWK